MRHYRGITRATLLGVRPERMRVEARTEALNEKGRNALEKAMAWTSAASKLGWRGLENKYGAGNVKKYSRAIRLFSTAAASTLIFGPIGTMGHGVSIALRLGRSVLGMTVGGAAAIQVGKHYENTKGKRLRSELQGIGRDEGEFGDEELEEFEAAFKQGSSQAIARGRMYREIATAIVVGGATSAATGFGVQNFDKLASINVPGIASVEHAYDEVSKGIGNVEKVVQDFWVPAAVVSPESVTPESVATRVMAPENLPGAGHMPDHIMSPDTATGVQIEHADQLHVSIDRPGEGADQAFRALQHKLEDLGFKAGAPGNSDDINRILSAKDAHELSSYYGFANEANESGYMHPNDSFQINEQGKIVFTPHDGPHAGTPTILEDKDSFRAAGGTYQPEHVATAPEQAPELVQEQSSTGEQVADKLTRESNPSVFVEQNPSAPHLEAVPSSAPVPEATGVTFIDPSSLDASPADVQTSSAGASGVSFINPEGLPKVPNGLHSIEPQAVSSMAETNIPAASNITERLHDVAQASPVEARKLAEAILSLKHDPSVFAQIVESAHHMEPNPQLAQELPYVKGPEAYLLQNGHLAVFGHAPLGSTLSDVEAQQNVALHIAKETGQNVEVRAEQGPMLHIARPDGSLVTEQVSLVDRILPPDINAAVLKVPKF